MKIKLFLLATICLVMVACSEQKEEGTLEKMGKSMDHTMDKATDYTGKKMQQVGNAIEQTGDDLEDKK
jgi:thiamine biosynthesis lipoprotein ApbE